jgi:hypothetical protein
VRVRTAVLALRLCVDADGGSAGTVEMVERTAVSLQLPQPSTFLMRAEYVWLEPGVSPVWM